MYKPRSKKQIKIILLKDYQYLYLCWFQKWEKRKSRKEGNCKKEGIWYTSEVVTTLINIEIGLSQIISSFKKFRNFPWKISTIWNLSENYPNVHILIELITINIIARTIALSDRLSPIIHVRFLHMIVRSGSQNFERAKTTIRTDYYTRNLTCVPGLNGIPWQKMW